MCVACAPLPVGLQACKALKEEGYEVILVNSNPATIMTDPGTADRTYVAPMTPELVEQVRIAVVLALILIVILVVIIVLSSALP